MSNPNDERDALAEIHGADAGLMVSMSGKKMIEQTMYGIGKDKFIAGWSAALKSKVVREMAEALTKAQNIIVEDECEECGTFKGVRYHIKEIEPILTAYRSAIADEKEGE